MSNKIKADECFQQAQQSAERGDFETCINSLRDCLQYNRFHLHANSHLAWMLSQQGNYKKAFSIYCNMLILRPWSIEIYWRAIQCLQYGLCKWMGTKAETSTIFKWNQKITKSQWYFLSFFLGWLIERINYKNYTVVKWMKLNRQLSATANINPYEYYKVSEMNYVISRLKQIPGKLVLDLGSGRSAIPTYIAMHDKCVITAELDHDALQTQHDLSNQQPSLYLKVTEANFLQLPFRDDTFDAITIISTIEHVPYDGDIETVKELRRVLKPGGSLLITIPVSHIANEQNTTHSIGHVYQECSGQGGFLRLYNPEWIQNRLINPSRLSLQELVYYGETSRWGWLGFGRNYIDHKDTIHPSSFAAPLNLLFTKEIAENNLHNAHWAVACIHLKKEGCV